MVSYSSGVLTTPHSLVSSANSYGLYHSHNLRKITNLKLNASKEVLECFEQGQENWCLSCMLLYKKILQRGNGGGNSLIQCRQLNLWSVRMWVRKLGNNKGKLNALQVSGKILSQLTSGIALGIRVTDWLLASPWPLPWQVFEGHLGDVIYAGDIMKLRQVVTISSEEKLGDIYWRRKWALHLVIIKAGKLSNASFL